MAPRTPVLTRRQRRAIALAAATVISTRRVRQRAPVHPFLLERDGLGEFAVLFSDLYGKYPKLFKRHYRIELSTFNLLFDMVKEDLLKETTKFKKPIDACARLVLTLDLLIHGQTFRNLAMKYRVGETTARSIFHETVIVIWEKLQPIYMPVLDEAGFREVEKGFREKWQFPNCVGAVDGKHVRIRCPANSGSLYRNYKGFFSMVLMAICDADRNFIMISVGQFGSRNDSVVFETSPFGQALLFNRPHPLPLPPPKPLTVGGNPLPHVFVGDEAFPLKPNLMRLFPTSDDAPHEQKVFNVRLSRARVTIENTFGILATLFDFFKKDVDMSLDKVRTTSSFSLPNFSACTQILLISPFFSPKMSP